MTDLGEWRYEYQFTTWLLENFSQLAELLELPLEIVGTEVRAVSYPADIVAFTSDDEIVVVEAQLWGGDHKHFGELLTYAAGLDATVAIWLAEDFSNEHLHAMQRLNRAGDLRLYAVRFYGRSPDTVRFDVAARPNPIQVKDEPTVGADAIAQLRYIHRFWRRFAERDPRVKGLVPRAAGRARWVPLPGCSAFMAVELFKSGNCIESTVYLLDANGRGEPIAERLAPHRSLLEGQLEPMGRASWPFDLWQGAVDDDQAWDHVIDNLSARMTLIERCVTPHLKEIV